MNAVEDRIRVRLGELSDRLGEADWLDGGFSAGDLMMVEVLLRLEKSGLLEEYPNLSVPMWPAPRGGRLQEGFRRSIGGFDRRIGQLIDAHA